MDADPAPEVPQLLPIRLSRSTPLLGCSFLIGALLTGLATLAWIFGHKMTEEKNGWLIYVFCGGFGFFGLLVLWAWFRQVLMLHVPVPIVEISHQPFRVGGTAKIALIQRGPAKLKSLRANLICLEQHITWRERSGDDNSGGSYRDVREKLIYTQNLVSMPFVMAPKGEGWHTQQEFTIPADAKPSEETDTHAILWRIELWGKGTFLGSYMHPFPVEVAAAEA